MVKDQPLICPQQDYFFFLLSRIAPFFVEGDHSNVMTRNSLFRPKKAISPKPDALPRPYTQSLVQP